MGNSDLVNVAEEWHQILKSITTTREVSSPVPPGQLQLLEESLKGVATLKVPTITRTMAKDSEPDDVSEDGSDVLDTVTHLDDETGKVLSQGLT